MANIKIYKKGVRTKLSDNFNSIEWDCRCNRPECQWTHIDLDHVKLLQEKRTKWRRPIEITCGYRCLEHNKVVGGVSKSQHLEGTATDIKVSGLTPEEVANDCSNFTGVGKYDTFVHLDSREAEEGRKFRWDFSKKRS